MILIGVASCCGSCALSRVSDWDHLVCGWPVVDAPTGPRPFWWRRGTEKRLVMVEADEGQDCAAWKDSQT